MERLDRRNLSRQQADARCERAALIVEIRSKPSRRSPNETEIQRPLTFKLIRLVRSQERQQKIAKVLRRQRFAGSWRQQAINSQRDRTSRHKDDVRGVLLSGQGQKSIEEVFSSAFAPDAERFNSSTSRAKSLSYTDIRPPGL